MNAITDSEALYSPHAILAFDPISLRVSYFYWSRCFFGDGMTGAHALPNSTKENNVDLLVTKKMRVALTE